jgi:hypothetical protein
VTRHAALRLWLAGTALAAGLGLADASRTEAHHRPGHRPTPTATPTPAPMPTPGGSPILLFSDDFDGVALDPARWRSGFWYCAAGAYCDPNSGSVLHVNHPRNCVVSGGLLRLTARREPIIFNGKSFSYTSCVVTTGRIGGNTGVALFEYRYGYAEVSLKAAPGVGMWSGLWFLRQWCDGCGNLQEVDAPEVLGNTPTLARYHWHGPAGTFGWLSRCELRAGRAPGRLGEGMGPPQLVGDHVAEVDPSVRQTAGRSAERVERPATALHEYVAGRLAPRRDHAAEQAE